MYNRALTDVLSIVQELNDFTVGVFYLAAPLHCLVNVCFFIPIGELFNEVAVVRGTTMLELGEFLDLKEDHPAIHNKNITKRYLFANKAFT